MEREPERRRQAVRGSLDQRNQKPGRWREGALVTASVPQKQEASALRRSPLGGNANSTGKCKCKEALRALCANSRPGSAAPRCCLGTAAPLRPGLRANSLCSHLPGGGGQARGSRSEPRAPRPARAGAVALPNGTKDRSAEARQVGQKGERGPRDEVRGKVAEARRKECWAQLWSCASACWVGD